MALLSSLHVLFVATTALATAFLVAVILVALFASLDVLLVAAAALTGAALVLIVTFVIGHFDFLLLSAIWHSV